MRFRDLPLARKALALGVVPTVCALAVTTLASGIAVYRSMERNLAQNGDALAATAAEEMQAPLGFDDPATARQLLGALRSIEMIDAACVYDVDGRLFASFARQGRSCPPTEVATDRRVHRQAVTLGNRQVGRVLLFVNDGGLTDTMMTLGMTAIATLFVVVVLAIVLARAMQRTISGPIVDLSRTADHVTSTGDYSVRAQQTTGDETGRLVVAFNTMLSQIQQQARVKDEFLATLSHELRTPLNAMLGWLQIIQRTNPGGESLERALGSLERNARVQQRVVEDLLDISRIVSGKLQMNMAVVDLRTVLNAAVEVTSTAARASRVTLRWDPPPLPLLVSGDAARLQQVLWNLLSNAVKFTPGGGTVTARVASFEDAYAIVVHDTGAGIDPGFLPRVFDRFQQADSSATREHGGLGLGLAIVKEIVSLHNGTVAAESAGRGRGATFTITLPRLIAGREERPVAVAAVAGEG